MWRFSLILVCILNTSALDLKELRQALMADQDFVAAKEVCLKSLGMAPDELSTVKHEGEIPRNILCFAKCIQEERGYLNEESHKMDKTKLETLPIFSFVNDEQKSKILDCLDELEIQECEDVEKARECFGQFIK